MTKRKKVARRQVDTVLRHLPEHLSNLRIFCSICRLEFPPPFLEPRPGPFTPVRPNKGPGLWIPIGAQVVCPRCSNKFLIDTPTRRMETRARLFGDDAAREHNGRYVSVYTVVGADWKKLPQVEESIKDFKQQLCPSLDPITWTLHMTNLWSGSKRKKHPIFSGWSRSKVNEVVKGLSRIICNNAPYLFVHNITKTTKVPTAGPALRRQAQDRARNEAFVLLIAKLIDECTAGGAQPQFFSTLRNP